MSEGPVEPKPIKWQICLIPLCLILFSTGSSYSREIDEINAAIRASGAKWVAEETPISFLPPEERAKWLGAVPDVDPDAPFLESSSIDAPSLPSSFDWRSNNGESFVTPVRNQGGCGSCWAFAVTAALEAQALITFHWPDTNLNLSEQIVVSCSGSGSCGGGSVSGASNFIKYTGTNLETCYPYTAKDGNCGAACTDWENTTYKVDGWSYVSATESALKSAIYRAPVVTIFRVYSDFFSYREGVYSCTSSSFAGYHAVLIVGWDDANAAFIVKNSWGTSWGESGYFRIAYSELSGPTAFGTGSITYGNAVYGNDDELADLTVTSVTGPFQGNRGSQVNVSATVHNQGSSNAGAFRLGFYLSTDYLITTQDTFTGSSCYFSSGLSASVSTPCLLSAELPPTLPRGTYYLGAIVDYQGDVPEEDENNNARSADTGTIAISDEIVLLSPEEGNYFDACSIYSPPAFAWSLGEPFMSYEVQFSQSETFSSAPLRIKVAHSKLEVRVKPDTWKRVLSIAGNSGGIIYWRVVGMRPDKTTSSSTMSSLTVVPSQAAGDPTISPTSIGVLPVLSWNNACNNEFKVWFGNDPDFAKQGVKKQAISFKTKNPPDETFATTLTPQKWKPVRRLVTNTNGSTIYWYVESWDKLRRNNATNVMSFVLGP